MPASGTPGAGRITVAAYQNEDVTITGADVIAGPWTLTSNGIYTAAVGWDLGVGLNNVFVGGEMTHEARTPNYGTGDVLHPATTSMYVNTTYTDVITSATFSGKPDNFWAGARLHAGINERWGWQKATVASSTGNSITVNSGTKSNWWFVGSGEGYLYGLLSLLDADKEWYVQNNGTAPHTLHLRVTGQTNPSVNLVEMRRRSYTVDFAGKSNITVRGLKLRCGDVQMNGSANVLEQCNARYLSHHLTYPLGYDKRGGVIVSGTGNTVRYCTIYDTAGCGVLLSGTSHTITRNHIYYINYSATYSNCISVDGSGHTITFNTAQYSGRDIITINGSGHFIAYNDLSSPGQMCHDLGVLYTWGSNGQGATGGPTRIAYNWVHDNYNTASNPLIYLDNWCRNYVVDHNVCWGSYRDSGIRLNGPRDGHKIYHNTLFTCDDAGTHTYTVGFNDPINPNPDPAFWKSGVTYSVDIRNNLFLGTTPDTQLTSSGTRDFRLKSGAAAINSATLIAGYNDTFTGSAPDKGAYEAGQPYWMPGVKGWSINESGIRSDPASEIGVTIARANGTLISAGSSPTTVQLYWDTSDGGTMAGAWGNVTTVGTNYTGSFEAVSALLYNLTPGITNYYRYRSTNAFGECWSDVQTVTPSTTVQTAIYPSTDLYIDPIQGVSTGGPSGDTQNTNPADDVIYSNADLIAARSGDITGDRRIFMKFDLSALPSGAVPTAATLRLYLAQTETYGGASLHRITQRDWTAANVTYNLGSSVNATAITSFADTTPNPTVPPPLGWYNLNVLTTVNGWLGGTLPNYGFAILGVEGWGTTRRQFTSSRGTAAQRPHLLVSYTATNLDTDNDTLPDEWETVHFGSPTAGIGAQDSDGDGISNEDEYTLGTSPRTADPANPPSLATGGGNLTLTFTARRATVTGYVGLTRYYDVQTTTDLANAASWVGLSGFTNITGNDQVVTVVQAIGATPRFFRLRVRLE
ncbi:MAG: DNRLRE domain-containing protein [Verrucomicrobiota bacterium]